MSGFGSLPGRPKQFHMSITTDQKIRVFAIAIAIETLIVRFGVQRFIGIKRGGAQPRPRRAGESRPVLYSVVWGVKICICVDFGFKATCGWNVIHHASLRNQPFCEVGKASHPRAEVKQQETKMNRNIYKGQGGK